MRIGYPGRTKQLAVLALLLVAAIGCGGSAPSAGASSSETFTFRMASFQPQTSAQPQAIQWYMDTVTKRTNNRVKFQSYWGGTLLPATDIVAGTSDGRVDVGHGSDAYAPDKFPMTGVWSLPFVTTNTLAMTLAMNDMYARNKDFRAEWDRQGLHVLSFMATTPNVTGMKSPITGVDSYKGKKIRAVAFIGQAMKAVGADPVALPVTDIYQGLQRGVIEGYSSMIFDVAASSKFYETAQYLVDDGVGVYAGSVLFINKQKWDSLPKDIQDVMTKTAQEFPQKLVDTYTTVDATSCTAFKAAGAKMSVWSADQVAQYKAKVGDSILKTYEAKTPASTSFYNQFSTSLKGYESKSSKYQPGIEKCIATK